MKTIRIVCVLALGLLGAGCARSSDDTPMDPLEPMNRVFFDMNQRLDRHAALPAASFYSRAVPARARSTFHNILDNLGGPVTFANDILQIDLSNAGIAAARFMVNSTVGVAGIFDVATDWGLPSRPRDFGETMGGYGVPPGPYLVLPLRGSSDLRDFAGNYLDGYASPLRYVRYDGREYVGLVKSSLGSVDNRASNIVTYRDIERTSVDFYATMRAYYLQRRTRQIEDRGVPTSELPDF